jgi:hypothetical protein
MYGADAASSDGRGTDMDVFGRKLSQIITADYTDIALAAGPLDIAGQVRLHAVHVSPWNIGHPAKTAWLPGWCGIFDVRWVLCTATPKRLLCRSSAERWVVQVPMLPRPPPEVERNPTLLAEYESVSRQIRQSCHQVALLDRVHNIKVCCRLTIVLAYPLCHMASACWQCLFMQSARLELAGGRIHAVGMCWRCR